MESQLTIFEAVMDILRLKPIFIIGFILMTAMLFWLFKKENKRPIRQIVIASFLLFYYLCIVLENVVGIPTISEIIRVIGLGESVFNPNINLITLVGGVSLEFILNIFCFIPLGFLCPLVSQSFNKMKYSVALGFGLSLAIELSQLFTLYRATDINDLIANTFGALLGFFCYQMVLKLGVKETPIFDSKAVQRLPLLIIMTAFVTVFIS
ncbi:VanZ family protein [Beduini massiliensis]|uniref:VanZ family protein n=1 Tax=Beduini massiliensis TaxID=1585974 RepID=UPI00059AAD24|nr:VanZ family protein [Beduini massiliensis]